MELTGLLYQTAQRRGCWQETTTPCRPCVPLDSFLTWRTLLLQPPAQGLFTEGLNRYLMTSHKAGVWGLKFIQFGGGAGDKKK